MRRSFALGVATLLLLSSPSVARAAPDGQEDICADPAVFFCDNFEARTAGDGDLSSPKYKSPGFAKSVPTGPQQTVVAAEGVGGSKAFQFQYPAGNNTGAGFMDVTFPGGPYRTVYYRWMARYSANFVWSAVATKHDEFVYSGTNNNAHIMWFGGSGSQETQKAPQILLAYSSEGVGHAFDQNVSPPPVTFVRDHWYCLEVMTTLNTCDTCFDGAIKGWIDDAAKFDYANIIVDTQGSRTIAGLLMSSYWNCSAGGDSCTGGALDTHPQMARFEDNLVASVNRVGCPGAILDAGADSGSSAEGGTDGGSSATGGPSAPNQAGGAPGQSGSDCQCRGVPSRSASVSGWSLAAGLLIGVARRRFRRVG